MRNVLRLTLLLFVPMEDQDAGGSLYTQTKFLGRWLPIFMNPEDVVLHADPVDVVLKHVNSEGLRNSWNKTKQVSVVHSHWIYFMYDCEKASRFNNAKQNSNCIWKCHIWVEEHNPF